MHFILKKRVRLIAWSFTGKLDISRELPVDNGVAHAKSNQ
jgi:hypothetical protein